MKGFTLIELSIVLAIIGLIIGGVMVGRDLISSAGIRAQVSQIEKYNATVNAFRAKYGGLPGDLTRTEAMGFGLYYITYAPYLANPGYGDNNGIINSRVASTTSLAGEPFMFWRQLSDAQLIDGSFGSLLNTAAECGTASTPASSFFPASKIGTGYVEANTAGDGKNYFIIANFTAIGGCGVGGGTHSTNANSLTAQEAYAIDSKIDDGLPASGTVFAINGTANLNLYASWTTVSAVATCVSSGAYAVNPGTTKSCSLRFKFQ
jgi:prepilin-type N-terminal cleavage/methylation domain-containing protein